MGITSNIASYYDASVKKDIYTVLFIAVPDN